MNLKIVVQHPDLSKLTVPSASTVDKKIYNGSSKNNLSKFPRQEVEQMLKNYFRFLFVRDPTERVVSAYTE